MSNNFDYCPVKNIDFTVGKNALGTIVKPIIKYTDGDINEIVVSNQPDSIIFKSERFTYKNTPIHTAAIMYNKLNSSFSINQSAIIKWKVSGFTAFDRERVLHELSDGGVLHGRVSDIQGDPRFGHGFVAVCDYSTGLWLGFTITKTTVHATYGIKEPCEIPSNTIIYPRGIKIQQDILPQSSPNILSPTQQNIANTPFKRLLSSQQIFNEVVPPIQRINTMSPFCSRNNISYTIWKTVLKFHQWEIESSEKDLEFFTSLREYFLWESSKQFNDDEKKYDLFKDNEEETIEFIEYIKSYMNWCNILILDYTYSRDNFKNDPLYIHNKYYLTFNKYQKIFYKSNCTENAYIEWRNIFTYDDYESHIAAYTLYINEEENKKSKIKQQVQFKIGEKIEVANNPARFMAMKEVLRKECIKPLNEYIRLEIVIDNGNGSAKWYVNSVEVYSVPYLGYRPGIWDRVLEHGGTVSHIRPIEISILAGTADCLDYACPDPEFRRISSQGNYDMSHIHKYKTSNKYYATRPNALGELVPPLSTMFIDDDYKLDLKQTVLLRLFRTSLTIGAMPPKKIINDESVTYKPSFFTKK
jgi:hypothetical protein